MKNMEVGEVRTTTIGVVKCVMDEMGAEPCHNCCFNDIGCAADEFECGKCCGLNREDGHDVHFELEKGGDQ